MRSPYQTTSVKTKESLRWFQESRNKWETSRRRRIVALPPPFPPYSPTTSTQPPPLLLLASQVEVKQPTESSVEQHAKPLDDDKSPPKAPPQGSESRGNEEPQQQQTRLVEETARAGDTFRERLISFYRIHNPSKLDTVDATLDAYRGKEELLFQKLQAKYAKEKTKSSAISPFLPPSGTGPVCFLEFTWSSSSSDASPSPRRVVIQLFHDKAPLACENFRCLCTGERGNDGRAGKPLCYRSSTIHRIVPRFCIQGGDFTKGDGTGGESIYPPNSEHGDMWGKFRDETPFLQHSRKGLLSMANNGPNRNGSQFFITLRPIPHLDGKHVVFGEVIDGMDVVEAIGMLSTNDKQRPLESVVISDCGEIKSNGQEIRASQQQQQTGSSGGHGNNDRHQGFGGNQLFGSPPNSSAGGVGQSSKSPFSFSPLGSQGGGSLSGFGTRANSSYGVPMVELVVREVNGNDHESMTRSFTHSLISKEATSSQHSFAIVNDEVKGLITGDSPRGELSDNQDAHPVSKILAPVTSAKGPSLMKEEEETDDTEHNHTSNRESVGNNQTIALNLFPRPLISSNPSKSWGITAEWDNDESDTRWTLSDAMAISHNNPVAVSNSVGACWKSKNLSVPGNESALLATNTVDLDHMLSLDGRLMQHTQDSFVPVQDFGPTSNSSQPELCHTSSWNCICDNSKETTTMVAQEDSFVAPQVEIDVFLSTASMDELDVRLFLYNSSSTTISSSNVSSFPRNSFNFTSCDQGSVTSTCTEVDQTLSKKNYPLFLPLFGDCWTEDELGILLDLELRATVYKPQVLIQTTESRGEENCCNGPGASHLSQDIGMTAVETTRNLELTESISRNHALVDLDELGIFLVLSNPTAFTSLQSYAFGGTIDCIKAQNCHDRERNKGGAKPSAISSDLGCGFYADELQIQLSLVSPPCSHTKPVQQKNDEPEVLFEPNEALVNTQTDSINCSAAMTVEFRTNASPHLFDIDVTDAVTADKNGAPLPSVTAFVSYDNQETPRQAPLCASKALIISDAVDVIPMTFPQCIQHDVRNKVTSAEKCTPLSYVNTASQTALNEDACIKLNGTKSTMTISPQSSEIHVSDELKGDELCTQLLLTNLLAPDAMKERRCVFTTEDKGSCLTHLRHTSTTTVSKRVVNPLIGLRRREQGHFGIDEQEVRLLLTAPLLYSMQEDDANALMNEAEEKDGALTDVSDQSDCEEPITQPYLDCAYHQGDKLLLDSSLPLTGESKPPVSHSGSTRAGSSLTLSDSAPVTACLVHQQKQAGSLHGDSVLLTAGLKSRSISPVLMKAVSRLPLSETAPAATTPVTAPVGNVSLAFDSKLCVIHSDLANAASPLSGSVPLVAESMSLSSHSKLEKVSLPSSENAQGTYSSIVLWSETASVTALTAQVMHKQEPNMSVCCSTAITTSTGKTYASDSSSVVACQPVQNDSYCNEDVRSLSPSCKLRTEEDLKWEANPASGSSSPAQSCVNKCGSSLSTGRPKQLFTVPNPTIIKAATAKGENQLSLTNYCVDSGSSVASEENPCISFCDVSSSTDTYQSLDKQSSVVELPSRVSDLVVYFESLTHEYCGDIGLIAQDCTMVDDSLSNMEFQRGTLSCASPGDFSLSPPNFRDSHFFTSHERSGSTSPVPFRKDDRQPEDVENHEEHVDSPTPNLVASFSSEYD